MDNFLFEPIYYTGTLSNGNIKRLIPLIVEEVMHVWVTFGRGGE